MTAKQEGTPRLSANHPVSPVNCNVIGDTDPTVEVIKDKIPSTIVLKKFVKIIGRTVMNSVESTNLIAPQKSTVLENRRAKRPEIRASMLTLPNYVERGKVSENEQQRSDATESRSPGAEIQRESMTKNRPIQSA